MDVPITKLPVQNLRCFILHRLYRKFRCITEKNWSCIARKISDVIPKIFLYTEKNWSYQKNIDVPITELPVQNLKYFIKHRLYRKFLLGKNWSYQKNFDIRQYKI